MLTVIISARHQECSVFIVSGQSPLPGPPQLSLSFDQMIFINFFTMTGSYPKGGREGREGGRWGRGRGEDVTRGKGGVEKQQEKTKIVCY